MSQTENRDSQRLDQWLWQARFFKSRSQATALVAEARVRVNGQTVTKPARPLIPGDVLTFPQGGRIRVVRVLSTASRRGPATEAQALYADLDDGPAQAGASDTMPTARTP